MPELPEVEVLVEALRPLVLGRTLRGVRINRARIVRPLAPAAFEKQTTGWRIHGLTRRAKYLVFDLRRGRRSMRLLGHLGMSGRLWVTPHNQSLPKHAAAVFNLGSAQLVFEDTRYFGRLLLDDRVLAELGPEPMEKEFTPARLRAGLVRSAQPLKVKLLDQTVVAGLGNIYVNEALYAAHISPRQPANSLSEAQIFRLRAAIRKVLRRAINSGSTLPIAFGAKKGAEGKTAPYRVKPQLECAHRFRVYDRLGEPCDNCQKPIERIVQGARSTFFCPFCQAQ